MLTISARESARQVVGTLVFVAVVLLGSIGAIGGGLAALSTIASLGSIDRAAIGADPVIGVAAVGAILFGVALFVAGIAVVALETVASGVRIGLDRSAALDSSFRSPAVAADSTARTGSEDERETDDAAAVRDGESTGVRGDVDRETPDPADWTARNSVERSRSSRSDSPADEWVFKGDESSDEADRTA